VATFSSSERRRRPKGDRYVCSLKTLDIDLVYPNNFCCLRQSIEISQALRQTFEVVVLTELFPQSQIDIYVQVLQSDGGTCIPMIIL